MSQESRLENPLFVDHQPSAESILNLKLVAAAFLVAAAAGAYGGISYELNPPDTSTIAREINIDATQASSLDAWVAKDRAETQRWGILCLAGLAGGAAFGGLARYEARQIRTAKKPPEQATTVTD